MGCRIRATHQQLVIGRGWGPGELSVPNFTDQHTTLRLGLWCGVVAYELHTSTACFRSRWLEGLIKISTNLSQLQHILLGLRIVGWGGDACQFHTATSLATSLKTAGGGGGETCQPHLSTAVSRRVGAEGGGRIRASGTPSRKGGRGGWQGCACQVYTSGARL